jgi:penicillin-insensitive murein DD-endopeptidase
MKRMRAAIVGAVCTMAMTMAFAWSAHADALRAWHKQTRPKAGAPEAIGGYSSGCVRGARRLAVDGKHHRVMRPSRQRMYGHPALISFITTLAQAAAKERVGTLLIGDLGQPRGGPAPSGHASHQTGLDVDIWYWAPSELPSEQFALPQREQVASHSVVDDKALTLNEHWSSNDAKLLKLAARDARVARVFVNPVIKQALCKEEKGAREWLAKLRPWWGHDEHFHVRLHCPKDSALCEPQEQVAASDGCAELADWLSPEAQAERERERAKYRARLGKAPTMPAACADVLR